MREIKFRAYHKKEKHFYYFDLETCTQTIYVGYYHPITGEKDCELNDPTLYSEKQLYTGLKDKNGKEIYEGDILESVYSTRSVEFYCGAWWLMNGKLNDKPLYGSHHIREDIGNIYENPELLEAK